MRSINLVLFLIFVALRTVGEPWMHSINGWLAYGLEFALCAGFVAANFRRITWRVNRPKALALQVLLSLVAGALVASVARAQAFTLPFDLQSPTLWLELLLIAPLLEELLFRLLSWDALRSFLGEGWALITALALLFAASHLAALRYVPDAYQNFVIYQGVYTFALGLHWGALRLRYRTWLAPWAAHLAFNLGFGLCALYA